MNMIYLARNEVARFNISNNLIMNPKHTHKTQRKFEKILDKAEKEKKIVVGIIFSSERVSVPEHKIFTV